MKKLFFAVSALAALSLLAPSAGFAQDHVFSNQVGMYMTNDGKGATGITQIGTAFTVYLVLTKPTDVEAGDAPYASVRAFECSLNFTPAPQGDLHLLQANFPTPAVDIGARKNIDNGVIDFVVAYGTPMPVTEESVELVGLNFLNFNQATIVVNLSFLSPIPSIPDEMVFESNQGDLRVMHSAGGSQDAGVFQFNGMAVAVESETFGSVKALFR